MLLRRAGLTASAGLSCFCTAVYGTSSSKADKISRQLTFVGITEPFPVRLAIGNNVQEQSIAQPAAICTRPAAVDAWKQPPGPSGLPLVCSLRPVRQMVIKL